MTQPKKCIKCRKHLSSQNNSGLCNTHYRIEKQREYRIKKRKRHLCLDCGNKVEKIIIKIGKIQIIKYPVRCLNCRKKQNEYYEKSKVKALP